MQRRTAVNLALASASVALTLAFVEFALRRSAPEEYAVWPPDLRVTFRPAPEVMPGIEGPSQFSINARGVRGDELSDDRRPRLLAIGGSTTECAYLDDLEAWPRLLQDRLAERDPRVWVGNVGRSGLDTRHHMIEMDKLLPQLPRLDTVLLLVGLNDLHHRLSQDTRYRPVAPKRLAANRFVLGAAFARKPGDRQRGSALVGRLRALVSPAGPQGFVQDLAGGVYVGQRERRRDAVALREALPDLSSALDAYRRNLLRILEIARAHEVQVVFATQPTIWRADLSEDERALLWMGGIGRDERREYYGVDALARGMARYNDVLRDVCRTRRVDCVELADTLPRDTNTFYDDAHFNEAGARAVADAFARQLLGER